MSWEERVWCEEGGMMSDGMSDERFRLKSCSIDLRESEKRHVLQ
jgi:hypothetical protein